MMTHEQRERIEQYLLGFRPLDDTMLPEHVDAVRKELLRRRDRQLRGRELEPAGGQAAPRRLGIPIAVLIAVITLPLVGSVWFRQAKANQRSVNTRYATKFLESFKDYYVEDLLTADRLAREAEELLPERSLIGLDSLQSQQIFATAKAARCLFVARLGNADAAISILREPNMSPRSQNDDSEARLLFDICLGKATQVAIETLNGKRRADDATAIRGAGLKFLESATQRTLAAEYLDDDSKHLLAAALTIDTLRIYSKSGPPVVTEEYLEFVGQKRAVLTARAIELLEKVQERDAAWWTQRLRIESAIVMLQERIESGAGTQRENSDRNFATHYAFYSSVPDFEIGEAYASGLNFEKGIFVSNLADLTSDYYATTNQESDEVGDAPVLRRAIELRSEAIMNLSAVPLEARTERHSVNTVINHSRRMELLCRLANMEPAKREAHMLAASLDAAVLQSLLGDLMRRDVGQLLELRQALGAALLGASQDEVDEFIESSRNVVRDFRRDLIDAAVRWQSGVGEETDD